MKTILNHQFTIKVTSNSFEQNQYSTTINVYAETSFQATEKATVWGKRNGYFNGSMNCEALPVRSALLTNVTIN